MPQKQSVMVRFTPTLDDAVIRIEAAAVATRLEEQRLESEYKASLVSQEIAESQSLVSFNSLHQTSQLSQTKVTLIFLDFVSHANWFSSIFALAPSLFGLYI